MARPRTKNDLIEASETNYSKLKGVLESIPKEHRDDQFHFDLEKEKGAHWSRDKNVRDVIMHVYEWQVLLLNFVENNMKGKQVQFLEEGYNWKTYGDMNIAIQKRNEHVSYDEAVDLLSNTHEKIIKLMKTFSNDELFSKNVYSWVGGSPLGSYFVSAGPSHYEWAAKKIKKFIKGIA